MITIDEIKEVSKRMVDGSKYKSIVEERTLILKIIEENEQLKKQVDKLKYANKFYQDENKKLSADIKLTISDNNHLFEVIEKMECCGNCIHQEYKKKKQFVEWFCPLKKNNNINEKCSNWFFDGKHGFERIINE